MSTYTPRYGVGERPPVAPLSLPRLKKRDKPTEEKKKRPEGDSLPPSAPKQKSTAGKEVMLRYQAPKRVFVGESPQGPPANIVPSADMTQPMGGPQWAKVERMDQPSPHARPMRIQRAELEDLHPSTAVMPDINDRARNREPGQMTMFPDLPSETERIINDRRPIEQKIAAQASNPPGWVNRPGFEEGGQGYAFRPKTERQAQAEEQRRARARSMKAASGASDT